MDKLNIGDYGRFNFILIKNGYETPFDLCAEIIDIDRHYILLRDNDNIEYLPRKADIKDFEAGIKPGKHLLSTV
jgi:hypothetical protein